MMETGIPWRAGAPFGGPQVVMSCLLISYSTVGYDAERML